MKLKVLLLAAVLAPFALTACSKQDNAPASEQQSASDVSTTSAADQATPEQQAAIDALDQPILDEKNTDVPAEKANAPADVATPAEEEPAQK